MLGVGKLRKWSHILKMFFITTQPPFADRFLLPSQLTNRVVKLQDGKKYIYRQEGSNPSNENSLWCIIFRYVNVDISIFPCSNRSSFATNRFIKMNSP